MDGSCIGGYERKHFVNDPPFGIQSVDSRPDPVNRNFPMDELERLVTLKDARTIALRYVHDDRIYADVWNSNTIYPQTRRWLRILVQIQTINAVCNVYERTEKIYLFCLIYTFPP